MSTNPVSITLPEGAKPGEYVIRFGEAEKVHNIQPIVLRGNFKAPSEYVTKREDLALSDTNTRHVLFDKKNLQITYVEGEQAQDTITVIGTLAPHPFLQALGINQTPHRKDDLLKLIRYKGHYFEDRIAHKELIRTLQTWQVQTTNEHRDINNRQGQIDKGHTIDAKVAIAGKSYTINVPLFEGYEPFPIQFTIEIDVNNGTILIYLISETFEELWETAVDAKFAEQRPAFEPFVIIEK